MTDARLLSAYRATTWTVAVGGETVPLRLDQPVLLPAPLLPAGIVTAYNPASAPTPEPENRSAQERLRAELLAAGARLAPALAGGTGPDAGRWVEPGFLVSGLGRARLVEIAGRYGQNAIVWIDGASASLLASRPGFCGAAVGDPLPSPDT